MNPEASSFWRLLEAVPDAMVVVDDAGRILLVNHETLALFGYAEDELRGQPVEVLLPERFRDAHPGHRLGYAGHPQRRAMGTNLELFGRKKDGTVFPAEISLAPTRATDGDFVVAAVRDISARKQVELAMQQVNGELRSASRQKSEFLAKMSHELRTPLNAIIGFSEALQDGLMGDLTDQQRGFIGNIFSSGQHLLELINDILDLSKVEAGKMLLDLETVDVASAITNCLSIIGEKAAMHHIRLRMDVADGLGSTQADARKLKQIVYNLLSNAVKFTHEGGQVTLHVSSVPRAAVGRPFGSWPFCASPLPDSEFTDFLAIRVVDNGIGIAPEALEHLFKPFSQVDSGLARRFEGTGLGLAMVKLLAELHGGKVAVESAVGEGSCFTVWLPLRVSLTAQAYVGHGA